MIKRFDNKNTFIAEMRNGMNLFAGAGFSILAKDRQGKALPLGRELTKELHQNVGPGLNDLSKYCSLMERKNKKALYDYLTERFKIATFDEKYLNLNLINLKNIFTTNIDNLFPRIIAKSRTKYINDLSVNGDCADSNGINYLPLHGNVDNPERGYVFSVEKITTIYNEYTRIWSYLSFAVEKHPTLFIGYNYNDAGVIEALNSEQTFQNAQKQKWIVLCNPTDDDIAYFEGLDFSIIISDTKEFLDELPNLMGSNEKRKNADGYGITKLFAANLVPKDSRNQIQRPIEDFFRGMQPSWTDIIRNVLYKTSHYKAIENSVFNVKKHTILIGAPISGKSTLAMQVAYNINFNGHKLIFANLTRSKAEYLAKIIGSNKVLIVIENFTDDIECVNLLKQLPNVRLICVDRSYNYEYVSHIFDETDFDIINVTSLTENDIQGVVNTIPEGIRKGVDINGRRKKDDEESFFEFVVRHIKSDNIGKRYKDFIQKLEGEDPELAEFLVLCAYMNQCRVPLSMEVAFSYFDDYSFDEVFDMRKQLADLLKEDDAEELAQNGIDGYRPRSSISTEAILKHVSRRTLAKVMNTLLDKVSHLKICNYGVFKKWAFDKLIVQRAFSDWKDGKAFYEKALIYDNRNPYILQQGALYLSSQRQHDIAFDWIDRANTLTDNKQFSIRNSHAIILFDANVNKNTAEAKKILDSSMEILQKCFHNDRRKTFHAKIYADQALRYYKKYNDKKAAEYLSNARKWICEEIKDKCWAYDLNAMLRKIDGVIEPQ